MLGAIDSPFYVLLRWNWKFLQMDQTPNVSFILGEDDESSRDTPSEPGTSTPTTAAQPRKNIRRPVGMISNRVDQNVGWVAYIVVDQMKFQ